MGCIEEEDGMACIEYEEGTVGDERHPPDVEDLILDEEGLVTTPQTRSDSTQEAGTSSTAGCNQ